MKKSLSAAASKALNGLYAFVLSALFLSSTVAAQGAGSVVESQGFTPGQPSSSGPAPVGNSDALSLLLDQNQRLQTEVQALRALVEEQGFELRKMQRDALSRYTDVDSRLGALESGATNTIAVAPAPADSTASTPIGNSSAQSANSTTPIGTTPSNRGGAATSAPITSSGNSTTAPRSSSRGTLQPAVLSEQQLYQMAYDSVINSNFERSIAEFDQYLSIYSEGRFVTNAHYWKGQAYLYLERFDEARASYDIIMNEAEPSPKLPDAMYGLSLAYQGLGNIAQARRLLNEIKQRFPNTGVANLADTRLLSLD